MSARRGLSVLVAMGIVPVALATATGTASVAAVEPVVRLERIGTEHGLSHNTVYAVLQDRRGFMWFGTQDGLDRFDGREFERYRTTPGLAGSLGNHWVHALLEDRAGRLWIGTRRGLYRMRADATFEAVPVVPQAEPVVLALTEDDASRIWVGTRSGLFQIDGELRVIGIDVAPSNAPKHRPPIVHAVRRSPSGEIWAVVESADGTFRLHRFGHGPAVVTTIPQTWAVAFSPDGRVLLTADRALAPSVVPTEAPGVAMPLPIVSMLHDSRDWIWVGTFDGLFLREAGSTALRPVPTGALGAGALASEINALAEDRSGAVWIGTFGGVLRFDPHARSFGRLQYAAGQVAEPGAEAVSAIVEDATGTLWVGTYGAGLATSDGSPAGTPELRAASRASRACGSYVWDAAPARGAAAVWISTASAICRVGPNRLEIYPNDRVCGPALALREDAGGQLWLGSHAGLCRFDPASGRWTLVGGASEGLVQPIDTLHFDPAGRLWLGSASAGFSTVGLVDPKTDQRRAFAKVAPDGVWDFDDASDGGLWLATNAGLVHFDPGTGHTRNVPGPPATGGIAYSVARDDNGRLWIGTNKGLVLFDPADGSWRQFDRSDGIENIEFNRHAIVRRRSGQVLIGGMHGVTVVTPAHLTTNPHPPAVALTAVHVLGRDGDRVVNPDALTALVLTPRDAAVTFHFAAIGFTQPHKNRHRFRLEGLEPDWNDAGTVRTARYTNLPPGRYSFRVTASNNDGVWNEQGTSLAVIVQPTLWQTWWARTGGVLALVALLAIAYRARVRRLLEIERLRLRIASDLHDELGSDLSGLALAAGLVRTEGPLDDGDRHRLARVAATAVRVMEGLRDIVWHVNPEHDTLTSIEAKVRSVADSLLAHLPHTVTVDAHRPCVVPMDVRRHLLLIYKELVANVARHAGAGRVDIELAARDNTLRLIVADDGQGFAAEAPGDGTGLASVRRRAAEIGAHLHVTSAPGRGTRVELTVRLRSGGRRRWWLQRRT